MTGQSAHRASEEQLKAWMVAGLDGSAADHAALLTALVPVLRGYFARRLGDGGGEVEDLVQDVLIAVHTRRETFDRTRSFSAWLFAIARHKLIDHFRRSRAGVPLDGLDGELAIDGFEASSNAQIDVDRLLETLPAQQAHVLRRTRLDGLSTAETAADTGLGESNVKVSAHRGLKALMARVLGDRR